MAATNVKFEYVNATYLDIITDTRSTLSVFREQLTFFAKGYKFMPSFRNGIWDGKIRLVDGKQVYAGLIDQLIEICKTNNFTYEVDRFLTYSDPAITPEYMAKKYVDWALPYDVRDYQEDALIRSIRDIRKTILSPTGSGKSFICYMMAREHIDNNRKILILVPELYHITQLHINFESKFKPNIPLKGLYKGINWKNTQPVGDANFVVSTIASLTKMPIEWFDQFDAVIGDEVHKFKAKTFTELMLKCINVPYRMGCTGSLDGVEVHQLIVNGLFGPIYRVATASELIADGAMAKPTIHAIILHYNSEVLDFIKTTDYKQERDFVLYYQKRIDFIAKLAASLKGNTVTLFKYRDAGERLKTAIDKMTGGDAAFIDGTIDVDDRQDLFQHIMDSADSQSVFSVGCFATGTDVPNLNNAISTHPSKSRTSTIQAVGRTVRMSEGKDTSQYFDIVDKLTEDKTPNHLYRHFQERLRFYKEEGYEVIFHKYSL